MLNNERKFLSKYSVFFDDRISRRENTIKIQKMNEFFVVIPNFGHLYPVFGMKKDTSFVYIQQQTHPQTKYFAFFVKKL